ncbi:MAG TPA: hypothetical protein VLA74_13765 [Nitrososphaeraceae archaeon]|nr:hypothetical protein [Nitrososphaeraceae archaeon]
MDQGSIEDINDYINDPNKFQILDSNCMLEEKEEEREGREERTIRVLSIDEFNVKYTDISSTSIDNQRSKN